MKKVLVVLTAVAVLGFGAVAFAAWGGPGYGHMGPGYGGYGYGMGPGMMYGYGPGYGPMMGYGPGYGAGDETFLKETADLRRTINEKRFDYYEAVRTGDEKKAESLSKELDTLYDKLAEKAPEGFRGRGYARGGYGPMMGSGYGCNW
jgi:hypothetical protein